MGWDGMGGVLTLGDWPALSGSNSSGFLLQKRGNPVSVGAPENSPKESGAVRTGIGRRRVLHRVFEWSADDLLIDLGLELLEPALQALDGVHALQQKTPSTNRQPDQSSSPKRTKTVRSGCSMRDRGGGQERPPCRKKACTKVM